MPTIHTPAHINSEIFERLRSSKYTPSVSHSLDSSLREGAGKRSHSSCRPETATLRAIFIAPTQLKSFLHSTIQRRTLPQSRPLGVAAPSEREPGNVPIHRAGRKPQRCGRFSSPLRNSKAFYIPPFNGRHSLSHALRACQLPQGGSREGRVPFIALVQKLRGGTGRWRFGWWLRPGR